jgi:transcriptional regulator with XRE-family HTH domain
VIETPETAAWKAAYARELGLTLQRLRLARGLSQERVAHLAGLSGYTYQKYEKGESKPGTPMNPRLFNLIALAEVLEVNVTELLPEQ